MLYHFTLKNTIAACLIFAFAGITWMGFSLACCKRNLSEVKAENAYLHTLVEDKRENAIEKLKNANQSRLLYYLNNNVKSMLTLSLINRDDCSLTDIDICAIEIETMPGTFRLVASEMNSPEFAGKKIELSTLGWGNK